MGAVLFELTMRPWTLGYTRRCAASAAFVCGALRQPAGLQPLYDGREAHRPGKEACVYGFAEPVTAAILAVTLLNTPFTVWDAMGFAAVFAMLAVLSVGGKKYAGRLDV